MARQDLICALKNALERGEDLKKAKKTLLNAGYPYADIEEAAKEIEKVIKKVDLTKVPKPKFLPPLPTPPQRKEEKKQRI